MYERIKVIRHLTLALDGGYNTNPLFSDRIIQKPLLLNFKMPRLESYHGITDPVNHLESFKSLMLIHGVTDATLYHTFSSTLKGTTKYWYTSLKPWMIHSFDQMSQLFVGHFVSSWRQQKESNSLMNVKQREGKSIISYLDCFNTVILEVRNLDQSITMAVLKDGLLKNDLYYSLEKTYARDFADMLARVEKYARTDEAFEGDPQVILVEEKREERLECPPRSQQHPHSPPRCRRSRTPP
ncbi:uncharacterized protein [Elaeis guineensis]|uniref:Uncharacterized protein LOC105033578 n=1 Tax=Elaeis guineensis var. tenera TaxID=51953 RepID=A0A6I9QD43_ELAGV|nr:uncharacterized protein LOC105033578 [Elaeis guineensis]